MKDRDNIKELFSEKLGNYEAKVSPELWTNIASQVGAAGTTTVTGLSVVTKWVISLSITAAVVVTTVMIVNYTEDPIIDNNSLGSEKVNKTDITETKEDSEALNQQEDYASEKKEETSNNDQQNPEAEAEELTTSIEEPNLITDIQQEVVIPDIEEDKIPENNHKSPVKPEVKTQETIIETEVEQKEIIPEPFGPEEVNEEEVQFYIGELPNVITPNGDRDNDLFEIESSNLTGFNVTILNDQNKVVYQSNDPNFSWDGTDQSGQPVPEGRYVYFITANEFTQDKPRRYSSLTVIR